MNDQKMPIEPMNDLAPRDNIYPDPFTLSSQANLPSNAPITEGGNLMISELLDDSGVSEKIRKRFYNVFHRDNSLTFLDADRKASKILAFDISKIDELNATPYYKYTFEEEMQWNKMRNIFETKLDRSQGISESVKNERIIQQSQFSENRQISQQESMGDAGKEGFLKRLLKKR